MMGKVLMSGCAAKATVPKYLLTFTHYHTGFDDTVTYNFVSGMTWGDFVSSKYNTDEHFSIYKDNIHVIGKNDSWIAQVVGTKSVVVTATDLIVENATYLSYE